MQVKGEHREKIPAYSIRSSPKLQEEFFRNRKSGQSAKHRQSHAHGAQATGYFLSRLPLNFLFRTKARISQRSQTTRKPFVLFVPLREMINPNHSLKTQARRCGKRLPRNTTMSQRLMIMLLLRVEWRTMRLTEPGSKFHKHGGWYPDCCFPDRWRN